MRRRRRRAPARRSRRTSRNAGPDDRDEAVRERRLAVVCVAGNIGAGSKNAPVNVRFLAETGASGLSARFGAALGADAAETLAATADAHVLAVDGTVSRALTGLLNACGAVVAAAGATTLVAATRAALERARERARGDDAAFVDALLLAFARAAQPAPHLRLRDRVLDLRGQAGVMGVVNVTPDSFYTRADGVAGAVAQARAMARDGAAIVDVGGQSYANGNARVPPDRERDRVVPAIRALAAAGLDVPLSVDTFTASVADAALAAGAHLVNDCSGLSDPALPSVVAKHGAALVVMHVKGELNVREPGAYVYGDALAEIVDFLYERTERAVAGGVARDAIVVDPGLEFGKEPRTDLEILDRFGELRALGYPVLLAASRKRFIGRIFDRPASELLVPSLAAAAVGIAAGARLVRAHDVAETVQLARMLAAASARRFETRAGAT
jgi:dihydropteroate synthase